EGSNHRRHARRHAAYPLVAGTRNPRASRPVVVDPSAVENAARRRTVDLRRAAIIEGPLAMASPASLVQARFDSPSSRAIRTGFVTLGLFSAGHFFVDLYSSALGVFQPVLGEKLGLSLTQAGLLGGLMVFASSVVQPAYGYLSDRYQSRLFSGLGPAVAGIFIASLGLAPNFGWLALMVLLGGSGIAAFHPQASSRATAGIIGHRGRWMA